MLIQNCKFSENAAKAKTRNSEFGIARLPCFGLKCYTFAITGLRMDARCASDLPLSAGVHQEQTTIARTLGHSWGPIFASGQPNLAEIRKLLKQYTRSVKLDWSLYVPRDRGTSAANLAHPKDSAPGKDGVPHRA